jgi:hypothetical protein
VPSFAEGAADTHQRPALHGVAQRRLLKPAAGGGGDEDAPLGLEHALKPRFDAGEEIGAGLAAMTDHAVRLRRQDLGSDIGRTGNEEMRHRHLAVETAF